jgi:hypothetical protein
MLCQRKIRTARASHLQVVSSKVRSPSDTPPLRSRTDPQLLRRTARCWTLASAGPPGDPPCASAAAAAAALAQFHTNWPHGNLSEVFYTMYFIDAAAAAAAIVWMDWTPGVGTVLCRSPLRRRRLPTQTAPPSSARPAWTSTRRFPLPAPAPAAALQESRLLPAAAPAAAPACMPVQPCLQHGLMHTPKQRLLS